MFRRMFGPTMDCSLIFRRSKPSCLAACFKRHSAAGMPVFLQQIGAKNTLYEDEYFAGDCRLCTCAYPEFRQLQGLLASMHACDHDGVCMVSSCTRSRSLIAGWPCGSSDHAQSKARDIRLEDREEASGLGRSGRDRVTGTENAMHARARAQVHYETTAGCIRPSRNALLCASFARDVITGLAGRTSPLFFLINIFT